MAIAYLIEAPYSQLLDNNGFPLNGGFVYTYAAGTTTPQATYTDATGTVTAANPIVLDAAGRTAIWANVPLKIAVIDSSGNAIRTTDNITPTGSVATNSVTNANLAQAPAYTIKGNNTGATANEQDLTVAQVKTLLNASNVPGISGLIATGLSGNTSTAASLTISLGYATDSTNATVLSAPSGFSWSVTNGNAINGYQGGTTLPNSSTIHFFICSGSSGTGSFASTSLSPTLPTGYNTYFRRIFSLLTSSSGSLRISTPTIEIEGGALMTYLDTPTVDINTAPTITATLFPVSVPLGIVTEPQFRTSTNTTGSILITTPTLELDQAPTAGGSTGTSTPPGNDLYYNSSSGSVTNGWNNRTVYTNTSAQIRARSTAAGNLLYLITTGYKDFRRI